MKKDFSQPFIAKPTIAHFLVEDEKTGNFICFISKGDIEEFGESQAARTLRATLESKYSTHDLAKFLYDNGFSVNSIREIINQKNVIFSFADETPGVETEEICYHVAVDVVGNATSDRILMPFAKFSRMVEDSYLIDPIVKTALGYLTLEQSRFDYK